MKRILIAAALFATLVTPAAAQQLTVAEAPETAAQNHGYATAALEKLCGEVLVVSDPKLRAKMDQKYKKERYRKFFLGGYAAIAKDAEDILAKGKHQERYTRCYIAGHHVKWLKFDAAELERLELAADPKPVAMPLEDKVRIYAPINAIAIPCDLEVINRATNKAMLAEVKSDQNALTLLRRLHGETQAAYRNAGDKRGFCDTFIANNSQYVRAR